MPCTGPSAFMVLMQHMIRHKFDGPKAMTYNNGFGALNMIFSVISSGLKQPIQEGHSSLALYVISDRSRLCAYRIPKPAYDDRLLCTVASLSDCGRAPDWSLLMCRRHSVESTQWCVGDERVQLNKMSFLEACMARRILVKSHKFCKY